MKTRTYIGLAAILAASFGVAWMMGEGPKAAVRGEIKNLAEEGDLEGTIAVGEQLMAQLSANNWDWSRVDQNLLEVPDQYNYQFAPEGPGTWTWIPGTQEEYHDDVAFYSNIYTWRAMERVPGIEGTLQISGHYIVGYKDGRVEAVPVGDVRLYPTQESGTKIYVFPGMSEYDAELPGIGDPETVEKLAAFKARQE